MAYGPNPNHKSSHVLIGKRDGEVVQLVDTSDIAHHVGPAANDIYLGIEFESKPARPWIKGQDPLTNQDELTPFQASVGLEILTWLSSFHSIPRMGPPKKSQWMNCKGRWHGVLGHADVASGGFYKTDHGDELMFIDYITLDVWPVVWGLLGLAELQSGMKVTLEGDIRGYVPGGFSHGDEVAIVGFREPFKNGVSDQIIEVADKSRRGWVKPSNMRSLQSGPRWPGKLS
jgi:hypothetical protein